MARRTPQEKKALSYTKDRRNSHGQNDKASRKIIRKHKRTPNRADRRREQLVLATAAGTAVAIDLAEQAEARLLVKKSMWLTKRWRKGRDAPLAAIVEYKLRRRARTGVDDQASVDARIERIRRRIG